MIYKGVVLFGLVLMFTCCSKKINSYQAIVIEQGIDCGSSYIIKFDDNVPSLPANNSENVFYEINLPEELKVKGKKINVKFREPTDKEIMVCTTLGQGYPQIFIESAE